MIGQNDIENYFKYESDLKERIDSCTSMDEVIKVIADSKGIEGSRNVFYKPEILIEYIDRVVKRSHSPNQVTRSCGLRKKVMMLSGYDADTINRYCYRDGEIYSPVIADMKLKYIATNVIVEQINWGSHEDPRNLLELNKDYEVEKIDVRSSHTKIYLKAFPGKSFNSVWFDYER